MVLHWLDGNSIWKRGRIWCVYRCVVRRLDPVAIPDSKYPTEGGLCVVEHTASKRRADIPRLPVTPVNRRLIIVCHGIYINLKPPCPSARQS